jgi:hypothetical protein
VISFVFKKSWLTVKVEDTHGSLIFKLCHEQLILKSYSRSGSNLHLCLNDFIDYSALNLSGLRQLQGLQGCNRRT